MSLSHLHSFWLMPRQKRNDALLLRQAKWLPPIKTLSAQEVKSVITTLGRYHVNFFRYEEVSLAKEIWKELQESCLTYLQNHFLELTPKELVELALNFHRLDYQLPLSQQNNYHNALLFNAAWFTTKDIGMLCNASNNGVMIIKQDLFDAMLAAPNLPFNSFAISDYLHIFRAAASNHLKLSPYLIRQLSAEPEQTFLDLEKKELLRFLINFKHSYDVPPRSLLLRVTNIIIKQMKNYTGGELATIVQTFANYNRCPTDAFFDSLFTEATQKLPSIPPMDHAFQIFGIALLGLKTPPSYLEAWTNRAEAIQKETNGNLQSAYSCEDTKHILWALAVLSTRTQIPPQTLAFAQTLIDADLLLPTKAHQTVAYHTSLRLGLSGIERLVLPDPDNETSSFELSFREKLINAGLVLDENSRFIPALKKHCDFACLVDGKVVRLEYDGPQHFVQRLSDLSRIFDGRTYLSSALIRQIDPATPLVRIPHWVGESLSADDFAQLKSELPKLEPGLYVLRKRDGPLNFQPLALIESAAQEPTRTNEPSASPQGVSTAALIDLSKKQITLRQGPCGHPHRDKNRPPFFDRTLAQAVRQRLFLQTKRRSLLPHAAKR